LSASSAAARTARTGRGLSHWGLSLSRGGSLSLGVLSLSRWDSLCLSPGAVLRRGTPPLAASLAAPAATNPPATTTPPAETTTTAAAGAVGRRHAAAAGRRVAALRRGVVLVVGVGRRSLLPLRQRVSQQQHPFQVGSQLVRSFLRALYKQGNSRTRALSKSTTGFGILYTPKQTNAASKEV
jgi:pyruvate/2-oxoglutarate dehydrogenase complex dihydrolipoamide acyltransferase (E2) component